MNNLYKIEFKYVENTNVDTIAYSNACKVMDESFKKNPVIAVGKSAEEVHENTLEFVQQNTSFKIRPESFEVTIRKVNTKKGFYQPNGFGYGTDGHASVYQEYLK